MWRGLLDLLFPRGCCACGARPVGGAFCPGCSERIEFAPSWRCRRCAGPLPPPDRGRELPICPPCLAQTPPFAEVAAPFVYGGAIAEALHRLKYRGRLEVAAPLAALLAGPCRPLLETAEVVAPIPLHPSRRRERGYDQALLLAREVARLAARPLDGGLLRRIRETQRQVGQGRRERGRNLEGAFEAAAARVVGRSIVVVDDVVTTGATASAAASALVEAGAAEVVVLALARAL